MNKLINNSKQDLTSKDIDDFENKYSLSLPANYKKFILKYNGGTLEDSDEIDSILSIKYGKVTVNYVIDIHQIVEKNIPPEFLSFALDWSDNPITINLTEGAEYGKIVKFYFDTDDKPEVIANSLEELFGVKSIEEL